MAMYVMEEMPDIHGTGEQVLYPRFAMMDQVSTEELIRQIASSSGFNVGDVEGVITQIGIEMAHQMAEVCEAGWHWNILSFVGVMQR